METRMEKASDDWFIPVFCEKHEAIGTQKFIDGGKEILANKKKYRESKTDKNDFIPVG